jgi:hypothetical protein
MINHPNRSRRAKYRIAKKNSGPFAMYQVCLARKDGKLTEGTVLSTYGNESEAHEAVQRYVAQDRDFAMES